MSRAQAAIAMSPRYAPERVQETERTGPGGERRRGVHRVDRDVHAVLREPRVDRREVDRAAAQPVEFAGIDRGAEVVGGVRETESQALLRAFFDPRR